MSTTTSASAYNTRLYIGMSRFFFFLYVYTLVFPIIIVIIILFWHDNCYLRSHILLSTTCTSIIRILGALVVVTSDGARAYEGRRSGAKPVLDARVNLYDARAPREWTETTADDHRDAGRRPDTRTVMSIGPDPPDVLLSSVTRCPCRIRRASLSARRRVCVAAVP